MTTKLEHSVDREMRKAIAQQTQKTPTETDVTKLYFIDIRGRMHEYTKVEHASSMAPIDGCDMLIRDGTGRIYSARSSSYFHTAEEAVANFRSKQLRYIDQSDEQMKKAGNVLGIAIHDSIIVSDTDSLSMAEEGTAT
jgi:hypothetical protein